MRQLLVVQPEDASAAWCRLQSGSTPCNLAAALGIPLLHAPPYNARTGHAYVILADTMSTVQHMLDSGAERLLVIVDPDAWPEDALPTPTATMQVVTMPTHELGEQLEVFADALHAAMGPLEAVVQPLTASGVMRTITRRVWSLVGDTVQFAVHEPLWPVLCTCAGSERDAEAMADTLTRCLQADLPTLRGPWSWRTGTIQTLARQALPGMMVECTCSLEKKNAFFACSTCHCATHAARRGRTLGGCCASARRARCPV